MSQIHTMIFMSMFLYGVPAGDQMRSSHDWQNLGRMLMGDRDSFSLVCPPSSVRAYNQKTCRVAPGVVDLSRPAHRGGGGGPVAWSKLRGQRL